MPSIDRPLGGTALHFHLDDARRGDLIDTELLAKAGRSARTLIKDGPLRVTLVALESGGALAPHRTDGPITVHIISGEILLRADANEWRMTADDLVSLGAGVEHNVDSETGGVFLLTVATVPRE